MKFYILKIDFSNEFASAESAKPENLDFPPKCNKCGGYASMMIWRPPYNIKIDKLKLGDFIYGGFTNIIVSENFKNRYLKSELNGINNFYKVNILNVSNEKQNDIQNYYTFDILIDEQTKFNKKKSQLKYEEWHVCNKCGNGTIKKLNGVYIIEETWSGLDIFYLSNLYGFIIVTERFAEFINKYEFTNIKLIEAEKYIPSYLNHSD